MVIILDQACKVGRAGRDMKQTCKKTYEAQDCEVCYAAHQLTPTHNKIYHITLLHVICFIMYCLHGARHKQKNMFDFYSLCNRCFVFYWTLSMCSDRKHDRG